MRILKILNTNAVIGKDRIGNTVLCLGNGVGFKKRIGKETDISTIEKQFILQDKAQLNHYEEVLSSIPPEYVLLAEKAIDYAAETYHMDFNEIIHITLVDHMYSAVCNYLDGISIPNSLLEDVRHFYPNEYAAGRHTLVLIKEKFGYQLPLDEIAFFAMHFVTAQQAGENSDTKKLVTFIREINDLIQKKLNMVFDEDSASYYRYISHLKAFALRVAQNSHYPHEDDAGILDAPIAQYPEEYQCNRDACKYIHKKYHYAAGIDETIYLTVHLTRLRK